MDLQVKLLYRQLQAADRDDRETRGRLERALVALYQRDSVRYASVLEVFEAFTMSFARKMKRGEEPLEDLRQVAQMGLLKALKRFDASVGRSFVSYAAPTILGELRRHYRDTGWAVHVPRSQQELAQKVTKVAREVELLGLEPTAAAIAEHSELTQEQVVEGRLAHQSMRATSLDLPVDGVDRAGSTMSDMHGQLDPGYEREDNRATIDQLTRGLPERDRTIIALRFGAELSQSHIGQRVGISQMQVSRELGRIVGCLADTADMPGISLPPETA